MHRYVGLDVHARSCTYAVVSASGKRLSSGILETNGRVLLEALRAIPGDLYVCLEEGTQSAWLAELFAPHVKEVTVVVPRESKGPKDDLRDAWARAEELRIGAIATRVYKAPLQLSGLRSAASAYRMATQDIVRTKNRLKAVFRGRGISTDSSVYEQEARKKWMEELPPAQQELAEWLGQQLDTLIPLRESAEKWLLRESRAHPIIRVLETAPGMGPIRTAQLVACVATPHRFRTRQQFWSYCGLGVVTRSSSDWIRDKRGNWVRATVAQTRGLSRKRQPVLKNIFKGAATTVIRQLPQDPLHVGYQRLLEGGTKPNLASVTLARRIAATVLSMWKHQEVYDPRRHNIGKT